MNKTLVVIGDSYSTPNLCVEPKDSFWGLAARDLAVDNIVNYSHDGFAFDLILHILLNETFDWTNTYFIIGIPPIARVALFADNPVKQHHSAVMFDCDFNSWPVGCNSLTNCYWADYIETFSKEKHFLSKYDHSWQEVLTLEKVFLIHSFLKSTDTKFIIANLTAPMLLQEDWEVSKKIMQTCNQLPECILFKDTQFDVNRQDNIKPVDRDPNDPDCWFGHHGPVGNQNWYQKVLQVKMKQLGWYEQK
jgi:hypothetical protein